MIVTVMVPLLVYLPSYFTAVVGMSPGRAGATLILLTAPTLALPLLGKRDHPAGPGAGGHRLWWSVSARGG